MHENKVINDLENIITYMALGDLNKTIESKGTIVTLNSLNREIMKMNLIRKFILQKFKSDVIKTFEKYNSKDLKIDFNYRKLLTGDNLDLSLLLNNERYKILVSQNKIEQYDKFNPMIEEKIEEISEYIKGLFRILKSEETSNLLSNNFYNDLYFILDDYFEKFRINGDGVWLSFFNPEFDKISGSDKQEILAYFYNQYRNILDSIFVEDDLILDNYRLDDSVSKRKILGIYNKKR